jgi:hypothetical protein
MDGEAARDLAVAASEFGLTAPGWYTNVAICSPWYVTGNSSTTGLMSPRLAARTGFATQRCSVQRDCLHQRAQDGLGSRRSVRLLIK